MAFDKVIDSARLDAAMKATADSIRSKTGGSDKIQWNENSGFSGSISGIVVGSTGTDTSDATATANDMAQGATAYVKGQKVTGNLSVITHISLDDEPSTPSVSPNGRWLMLDTPETTSRFIADKGTTVSCGALLSDLGDASPADVAKGKTFTSVNGLKEQGTFSLDEEMTEQDDLIAQIEAALEGKAGGSSGEDVTAETATYTEKLEELETAITALESELEGKAAGGTSVEVWTGTVYGPSGLGDFPDTGVVYVDETLSVRQISVSRNEEATIRVAARLPISAYNIIGLVDPSYGTDIVTLWHNAYVIVPTADGFTIGEGR